MSSCFHQAQGTQRPPSDRSESLRGACSTAHGMASLNSPRRSAPAMDQRTPDHFDPCPLCLIGNKDGGPIISRLPVFVRFDWRRKKIGIRISVFISAPRRGTANVRRHGLGSHFDPARFEGRIRRVLDLDRPKGCVDTHLRCSSNSIPHSSATNSGTTRKHARPSAHLIVSGLFATSVQSRLGCG